MIVGEFIGMVTSHLIALLTRIASTEWATWIPKAKISCVDEVNRRATTYRGFDDGGYSRVIRVLDLLPPL